jgi:hypothetical protein
LVLAIAPGVTVSADEAEPAAWWPSWFVTVGYEPVGMVRPVASVMTYVRLMKQLPLVVVVNAPPLRVTVVGEIVTACGKLVPIVYGGVPPKM